MSRSCPRLVDLGRRQFLRGGGVAAVGAAAATVAGAGAPGEARAETGLARVVLPGKRLANLADLTEGEPVFISYPDESSPGVLIKLGVPADGGVGPDGDVVAFSTLCPHKGFPLTYVGADRSLNCPGHYSRFDAEKGGQQIWGQATQNLPQFHLVVDEEGEIHADGVDELIYGRLSNSLFAG
ncbi:MAG: arsenate reductase (azurin) small subunit [Azospirillaceae bacterium]